MLRHLHISNIALIDKLDIDLSEGFTVLTGETGAGKSILLEALGLALGNRAEARFLKSGENQGFVTAEFLVGKNKTIKNLLEEQGIEIGEELILRRVIYSGGKTRAFVNDVQISANILADIGEAIIEIHGQHEQRGLLNPSTHRLILDQYGKINLSEIEKTYNEYQNKLKNYNNLLLELENTRREEEYLSAAEEELRKLDIKQGEEIELSEKRIFLSQRDKLVKLVDGVLNELNSSKNIVDTIYTAERMLSRATITLPESIGKIRESLDRAAVEVTEAVNQLETVIADFKEGEQILESIEDRLFELKTASRKYGKSIDELPGYSAEILAKLSSIKNQDDIINSLKNELDKAREEYSKQINILSNDRKKLAKELEKKVSKELIPLKMQHSLFQAEIIDLPEEQWGATGRDKVQFLVKTNPGSPFGPINKIASGGELSRFMLALKVALAGANSSSAMIFDEVDAGVGGATADAIGRRIVDISKYAQVLTVTHHPQVAALANHHIKVIKEVKNNKTHITIRELSPKERKEELARMLSGAEITDESRAAAESLMKYA